MWWSSMYPHDSKRRQSSDISNKNVFTSKCLKTNLTHQPRGIQVQVSAISYEVVDYP